ncbi:hypothetical protein JOD97_002731 [Duganella sp. 1411]|nr:hypothetical protein [Duganella sp. 1411]
MRTALVPLALAVAMGAMGARWTCPSCAPGHQ